MTSPQACRGRLRRDAGTIRHAVRVWRKAVALGTFGPTRNVTWSNDHGKNKFVRTIFVFQSFDVADRDFDLLAGQDVGHGLREDVRTLLIQQARSLAVVLCSFVNR